MVLEIVDSFHGFAVLELILVGNSSETATGYVMLKKMFLKISEISGENGCAGVSFT